MLAYSWLENWNLTPMDRGLPLHQVDVEWETAVMLIKTGYNGALELKNS